MKGSSSFKLFGSEYCESSVTMNVRCGKNYLLVLLPVLACISLIFNGSVLSQISGNHLKLRVGDNAHPALTHSDLTHPDITRPDLTQPIIFTHNDHVAPTHKNSTLQNWHTFLAQNKRIRIGQKNKPKQRRRRRRRRKKKNAKTVTSPTHKAPISIEPTSSALSTSANFSACLLIKDDNAILNEWIAYHYHVLRMRRLIVAVDPLSSESPASILDKWSSLTDLEISQWNDTSYMPDFFLANGRPQDEFMQQQSDFDQEMTEQQLLEISNHRYRQRVFFAKCMRDLRARNSSWLIHIDTDEYVVPSKLLRETMPPDLSIPPIEEPGSVLTFVQQVVSKKLSMYPCISLLRLLFGSIESNEEQRKELVPPGFNAKSFETLRWRYHANPQNMKLHGSPKTIIDVSAIPEEYLPQEVVYSIHRPVEQFCQRNKDLKYENFLSQSIAANHYLGSWERYSARADNRRSKETYDNKAHLKHAEDDGVRPWLTGFVKTMGFELASKLLGDSYLAASSRRSDRVNV